MAGSWHVTVPLSLRGEAAAVEKYTSSLQAHLERICPGYQPKVELGPEEAKVVFTRVPAGTEQTASGKALYWIKRAVQRERSIRWSERLIGEGIVCLRSE